MSSNWRELLRAQEEDLKRMEEMDAALNEDQEDLDMNIKSILKGSGISGSRGRDFVRNSMNEKSGGSYNEDVKINNRVDRPTSASNIKKTTKLSNEHHDIPSLALGGRSGHHGIGSHDLLHDEDADIDDDLHDSPHIHISKSDKSILSPSAAALKDPHLKQAPDTTARFHTSPSITLPSTRHSHLPSPPTYFTESKRQD